ncbi:esterase, partial [Escherichia coli]|nr:esterase [Escherichia coli]
MLKMSSYYARRPLQSSGCSNSDSCWDGAPIEITESGPSVAGRLAALA